SGEKFRFVVLNRSGEKLLQSGQFDDKSSTKRAASSLAKAVSGAEIVDAIKPAAAAAKNSTRRPVTKR
ncbi:MAG: YegP family protein, partial [Actinomycetota bacterium]|nr:YegP family protein [Actinomycetota bacterium]